MQTVKGATTVARVGLGTLLVLADAGVLVLTTAHVGTPRAYLIWGVATIALGLCALGMKRRTEPGGAPRSDGPHAPGASERFEAPYRLRRWLPARLFGTTVVGVTFFTGALISLPWAVATGGFGWDWITALLFGGSVVWAAFEATAWAEVDDRSVSWRAFLLTYSVPIADVVDVDEAPSPNIRGALMQVRLTLRDGRTRRMASTTSVGNKARRDFENAVRAAAGLPPGPDVRVPHVYPDDDAKEEGGEHGALRA